jgi:hypothetical protein
MLKARKYIVLFFAGIALAVCSSFYAPTQTDSQEYILKAAFISRFTDYIDWPNESSSFNIGILGESEIISPLNEIAKGKKIKSKNIVIKLYNDLNDVSDCQVLFVSHNYTGSLESVVSKIGTRPILIITEQKGACEKGADINFIIEEDKLRFEINLKAAYGVGFKVSSQLLQHAILINPA